MLWVVITLMVTMAVSFLLDIIDQHSEGNRNASLSLRGLALFICMIAILEKYAS